MLNFFENKKNRYFGILGIAFLFFPLISFATGVPPKNFADLMYFLMDFLKLTIPVFISLGILAFLAGVAIYILKGDSETERAKGQQIMFWGIVAIFTMVSMWGLVNLLYDTFFSSSYTEPPQQNWTISV